MVSKLCWSGGHGFISPMRGNLTSDLDSLVNHRSQVNLRSKTNLKSQVNLRSQANLRSEVNLRSQPQVWGQPQVSVQPQVSDQPLVSVQPQVSGQPGQNWQPECSREVKMAAMIMITWLTACWVVYTNVQLETGGLMYIVLTVTIPWQLDLTHSWI